MSLHFLKNSLALSGLRLKGIAAIILGFMVVTSHGALAQTGTLIGESGAWGAYRVGSGADVVCFVTSTPHKLEGKYNRNNRGETRVFVTHRGGRNRGEVSVVAGYRYKEGTDIEFNIDGKKFNLFFDDTRAWANDSAQDKALVDAMKRGNSLKVTGVSSRGNKTIDTYSLSGFTAAIKRIDRACS